jgi:hypothetical protein
MMPHLAEAKRLAQKLKGLVKEAHRLDTSKTLGSTGKTAVARTYEFYVAFRALCDILNDWDLELVNHRGKKVVRFPHAPSDKDKYPYFEASNSGQVRFQLCLGTTITGTNGSPFSPDLSVQTSNSSLNPSSVDFVFGWDQKHTSGKRLNRDETAKVSAHLKIVPPLAKGSVTPFKSSNWPNGCSVITNANCSTVTSGDLIVWEISEVYDCTPGKTKKTRP